MAADHTVATGLALLAAQAPLEPGQLLEDVRLTVRGILRARRDHSASISFLELSDSSDEAGQMLQVCINRTKCDDTPSTKHALEQLNIGDTLCCSGPPGRTRTGRAEPTLFARSIALVRATREPARVLRGCGGVCVTGSLLRVARVPQAPRAPPVGFQELASSDHSHRQRGT